jgi:hypothetical protein
VIAIAEGVVIMVLLCLGAIALGAGFLPDLVGAKPETRVAEFYAALEAQDYDALRKFYYIPPGADATLTDLVPMLGWGIEQLESLVSEHLGADVELKWEFINLSYVVLEKTRENASVQVVGKVRIYVASLNVGATFDYKWTHQLVKHDGKWYFRP